MRKQVTFAIFVTVALLYVAAGIFGMVTGDFTLASVMTPAALLAFVFLGGRELADLRKAATSDE